jgi:hypothetical protein
MSRKKIFPIKKRLQILTEADKNGVKPTLAKYGIHMATYNNWKQNFEEMGLMVFENTFTPEPSNRIQELEAENERLKAIIEKQKRESQLRDELLAKRKALEEGRRI